MLNKNVLILKQTWIPQLLFLLVKFKQYKEKEEQGEHNLENVTECILKNFTNK